MLMTLLMLIPFSLKTDVFLQLFYWQHCTKCKAPAFLGQNIGLCVIHYFLFYWFDIVVGMTHYRSMLCIRSICYGPVSVCLSVSVSVCLSSQVGVLLKRLNIGSYKQNHTIAQGL